MAYGEFSSTGPDDMLREHLANGLPAAADVVRLLHASGRQMEIVRGKSMNLRVRRWVMRRWMGPGFWNLVFYRAGVLLIPFRRRLDAGPCYRAVLDVRLTLNRDFRLSSPFHTQATISDGPTAVGRLSGSALRLEDDSYRTWPPPPTAMARHRRPVSKRRWRSLVRHPI